MLVSEKFMLNTEYSGVEVGYEYGYGNRARSIIDKYSVLIIQQSNNVSLWCAIPG